MKITDNMVKEFNNLLSDFGCIFKLELSKDINNKSGIPIYKIVPTNNFFVKSTMIEPNRQFYVLLEDFFIKKYNVELRYDKTRTMFWSKYGLD